MINLAQMEDLERLLYFYDSFMNNLFPEAGISVIKGKKKELEEFPIATIKQHWGRVEVQNIEAIDAADLSLFRNSVGLLSIIIENKLMYQQLSREKDQAQNITEQFFSLSPELLCIASMDGYFVKLNQSWSRLLGWTEEELKALPWIEFVHPDDRENTVTVKGDLAKGQQVHSFENRYRSKDGHYYCLSWNSMMIPDAGYIFAVARDVTNEKAALERDIQAGKLQALGQLAGGVAHDFNNQLTGILGFAELAYAETKPDSPIRGYMENIIKGVSRSQDLTFQLLAYARKGSSITYEVDINVLIDEVSAILKRTSNPNIIIKTEKKIKPATILGDSSQLQNMLLNLCINARDAMPHGGALNIRSRITNGLELHQSGLSPEALKENAYICLEVEDTGEGIDPAIRDRIYDPFFTTKPLQKGTGIGLSAVFGTVKKHQGYICFDSSPEEGTCFKLYFPSSL